jgi:4-hydroxy-tetrahydrodipicolinate synthase
MNPDDPQEGVHEYVEDATWNCSSEFQGAIKIAKENSNDKIKIIAGTGSNNTKESIALSKEAQKAGAHGLIIVTPYYNRPSQEGLYQHYKAINDKVNIFFNCD